MPGGLRMLTSRGVWVAAAALASAAPAAAQPPADPIAASNQLDDPWMAPSARRTAPEAPWLVPAPEPKASPSDPPGKALLARIKSPATAPATQAIAPEPVTPAPVTWSAPPRRLITSALPTSTRPMIPCEPVVMAPVAAPPTEPPLPPSRNLMRSEGEPQWASPPPPPQAKLATTSPDDEPPPRAVTTIRFVDDPPAPLVPPAVADEVIMAIVRRGGAASGSAADIRAAVERLCRGKVTACQTEVAGERQVRVMLTVHSAADWEGLYERMQNLTQLGEYGLLFQVQIEK